MANITFDTTDPRSPDYHPLWQAQHNYYVDEQAYGEALNDKIEGGERYRKWTYGLDEESLPDNFTYRTSIPPAFYGSGSMEQLKDADYRTGILPLTAEKDPNWAYGRYANLAQRAENADATWKTIANMGTDGLDTPFGLAHRNLALKTLAEKYIDLSNQARQHKTHTQYLQDAYTRQIGIQNLRNNDPEAAELAGEAEQAQRDHGRLMRERATLGDKGIPIPRHLVHRIEQAAAGVEKHLGNWDAILEKKGFQGPKGPYLLSGVPLQFLDDMSDRAAFYSKRQAQLQSEAIKMFQSRYANDAPFRASVNQGLKAKVPGVLAAGLGGYIVKEKMEQGESLPAAVTQTVGEGLIAGAKFKFWDRFFGPIHDLNAGEAEFLAKNTPMYRSREGQEYIAAQERPKPSVAQRMWDLDKKLIDDVGGIPKTDKQVGDEIRNATASGSLSEEQKFQIKRVNNQVAKIEKEKQTLVELKQAQAEHVSEHIQRSMSLSPLWNDANGYDKKISPRHLEPIAPDKRPSPSNLRDFGYTPL